MRAIDLTLRVRISMMSKSIIFFQRVLAASFIVTLAFCINLASMTFADAAMVKPTGKVLLVVTGKINETNMGAEAHLDRALLQSIGIKKLSTSNQYEPGVHDYEGVMLKDLLSFVGASGTTLVALALDGYSIEIPVHDAERYPVLLAMEKKGEPMTVREKGPIWVIYPIDQFKELHDQKYSSRSIWQLNRIDVQ